MNPRKALSVLATLCLILWSTAGLQTFAADFTVSSTSDCSLADAINAANSDQAVGNCSAGDGADTIFLSNDITLNGYLPTIRSNITINTNDHTIKRVISGNRRYGIFNVEDSGRLTLRGLELIDAHSLGMQGGALRLVQGQAHLTDVRLRNNWAQRGGGAIGMTIGSAVHCALCQFVSNMSGSGGAIWVGDQSSIALSDSLIHSNAADRGGAIFIRHGSADIIRSTFSRNVAAIGQGSDILSIDGALTIDAHTLINPAGIVTLSD